ncbi:MAG: hypothetical protein V3S22_03530 [Candidatus Neomarinimicrobiota bacterium]
MENLKLGKNLKSTGKSLIKMDYGLTKVISTGARIDTVLIAVHGYNSTGYEWVYPLKIMAESGWQTYFYRWDWAICPNEAAQELKAEIITFFSDMEPAPHLIIFGHSYGGVITTLLAKQGIDELSADFHALAAPLLGFPRLNEMCSDYSGIPSGQINNLTQWRTVHVMDGAFRDMALDPQLLEIENSVVINLPDSTDGHRLGHNWSISWVMDTYFEGK